VESDYARHSRLARQLAEEFAAGPIVERVLDQALSARVYA
jgi:hypothetical protein